jgi:hypothetical protein
MNIFEKTLERFGISSSLVKSLESKSFVPTHEMFRGVSVEENRHRVVFENLQKVLETLFMSKPRVPLLVSAAWRIITMTNEYVHLFKKECPL